MKYKDNNVEITEKITGEELHIFCSIEKRSLSSIPRVKIYTNDIISMVGEKHTIIDMIKEDLISNSSRGGHKQEGQWIFKIKKPRRVQKKTTNQTTPRANKNNLTKPTMTDRIKKIAKNKIED